MSEVLLTGLEIIILNSRQNHSKNKLVSENAETQVHASCLLGYGFLVVHVLFGYAEIT